MPFEYKMLVLMSFFALLAWVPSSIAKWQSFGPKWLLSNRKPVVGREINPWGARAERAYNNFKDNFPAFIATIFLLGLTNHFDVFTAWASGLYVALRVSHFISYLMGNVTVRALSYTLALGCNLFLLLKVLL